MASVIIVGAGPAGCEAAFACARAGTETLLLSQSLDTVFLDRYGTAPVAGDLPPLLQAAVASAPGRVHRAAKAILEREDNIHLQQCSVSGLLKSRGGRLAGVSTWEGPAHEAPLVALCTGSFLQARLRAGSLDETAGHPGEMAYDDLGDHLQAGGFAFRRERVGFDGGSVEASVLDPGEFDPEASVWLHRQPGLAAAGFCRSGYLDFVQAARAGAALGAELARAAGSGRQGSDTTA